MPIDYTALPLQPPAPLGPDATDDQRRMWLDQHRICASYAHGAAQQATAEAMEATMGAMFAPAPPRRYTRAELALILAPHMPQVTGLTDLGMADLIGKTIDGLVARFPDLLAGDGV